MKSLIPPTVNLNGDTADDLVEQCRTVCDACYDLIQALSAAVPNGRNYQTQPDHWQVQDATACERARDAHHERMLAVSALRQEFLALALNIQDQKGGKS